MKHVIWINAVLLLLFTLPASASDTVNAVWKKKEVSFDFIGVDTAYTCDSMENLVTRMLNHLGATKDVKVTTPPCVGGNEPQSHFRIKAEFSTLVPAAQGDTGIVKARWNEVALGRNEPQPIGDSDCQLVGRFDRYVLPSIDHKDTQGTTGCGATNHNLAGRLTLKVLQPVQDTTG